MRESAQCTITRDLKYAQCANMRAAQIRAVSNMRVVQMRAISNMRDARIRADREYVEDSLFNYVRVATSSHDSF